MFTQKPQEPSAWAALPGEPLDRDGADLLPEQPVTDPLGLGLGGASSTTSASVAIPLPSADADAAD